MPFFFAGGFGLRLHLNLAAGDSCSLVLHSLHLQNGHDAVNSLKRQPAPKCQLNSFAFAV